MLYMDYRMRCPESRPPRHDSFRVGAHTLVEVVTVVLILSILAAVAVPRINFAAVGGVRGDAAVRQIATDLRRTRANALLEAARNCRGFALVMTGGVPYNGYEIVDLRDSAVVATCKIAQGIRCSGGQRFVFGPLGNLAGGSDAELHIVTDARTYTLEIAPATGAVTWTRHED
jgi:hypothetical protein